MLLKERFAIAIKEQILNDKITVDVTNPLIVLIGLKTIITLRICCRKPAIANHIKINIHKLACALLTFIRH